MISISCWGGLRPQKGERAPADAHASSERPHETSETAAIVICANCRHRLADASAAIEVDGRHRHTCVNPGGIVYRIACYGSAPGCTGVGPRSDFFSWFAGYFWQVLGCARCGVHLGWAFSGPRDRADFAGLIVDRIAESDG